MKPKIAWRQNMTIKPVQQPSSQDEMDIQALMERWAKAVREQRRGFAPTTTPTY
jgi:hypothetical protein